jgi:type VI secretion system secreted protein VgrG
MSDSSQRAADYAPVEVDFKPDPGFEVLFDGLHAEEELGRPFLFQLEISSGKLQSNVSSLVGSECSIWMYQPNDEAVHDRYFHGIVTKVAASGLSGGAYRYKVELRPWVWILSHQTNCKIFQKKSAFQIVTQVFRDAGFSNFEDKRQSGAGDTELEYCVQYNETSLDFVTRLMEQFGFYYYFTYTKSAHTLVIVDDPNAHTTITNSIPYEYDKTEYRAVAAHIWQWSTEHNLNTGKWTSQDYNFKTPSADFTAKTVKPEQHQYGDFETYEYPGRYDEAPHGQRHADVRMQSVIGRRQVFTGESNSRDLHAGFRFQMTNYPDQAVNRDYLIIRSVTSLGSSEGNPNPNAETFDTYRVTFETVPGDTPFRLQQITPRPMIRGPQTARVVGDAGEEITTDEYGRIKVRFHWDRADTQDSERTCWIRVSQSWSGGSWGAMVLPRIGQEVVVAFLEGNPDRPLVTGVVYNANNQVPHSLPDNKTRTVLKTNSSPGGNGFNELHFEDKAGKEEVYLHAERDYRREIKHDEIVTVENDRTVTVTSGNDSLTVSAGDHSISVSAGASSITAAKSITLKVGGNSITIDTSGISINGMKIDLQASGPMSLSGATIALN